MIVLDAAASRSFPPEVAMYVVKIACERPDELGRSLSQWDCTEIARQLVREFLGVQEVSGSNPLGPIRCKK